MVDKDVIIPADVTMSSVYRFGIRAEKASLAICLRLAYLEGLPDIKLGNCPYIVKSEHRSF